MQSVTLVLEDLDLAQYAQTFMDHGYTSLDRILLMNREQLEELSDNTTLFGNQFRVFVHRIQLLRRLRGMQQTRFTPPATVPLIPEAPPPPPARPPPPAQVPHVPQAIGTLKMEYPDSKAVKLASLLHSTHQLCKAHLDYKNSGSRCKIYKCASVRCTKKRPRADGAVEEEEPQVACDYKLHWALVKKSFWQLKLDKSNVAHHPMCHLLNKKMKVTNTELQSDPAFIQHVNTGKGVTGNTAKKSALGGKGGRVDGSVKEYTARRALNQVKQCADKDYIADWSKLEEWGREFERINPGSRFELK